MHDGPEHDVPLGRALERAIATLREPVSRSPEFDERLTSRLPGAERAAPMGARVIQRRPTVRRFLALRRQPLAMAAGLAIAALGVTFAIRRVADAVRTRGLPEVRFTLVAPGARSVAVVGDFNHWSATASPLTRARADGGTWATTVRMTPGPHMYSFLIDGTQWVADPHAPRSTEDDFGRPSAVVTVAGHAT